MPKFRSITSSSEHILRITFFIGIQSPKKSQSIEPIIMLGMNTPSDVCLPFCLPLKFVVDVSNTCLAENQHFCNLLNSFLFDEGFFQAEILRCGTTINGRNSYPESLVFPNQRPCEDVWKETWCRGSGSVSLGVWNQSSKRYEPKTRVLSTSFNFKLNIDSPPNRNGGGVTGGRV